MTSGDEPKNEKRSTVDKTEKTEKTEKTMEKTMEDTKTEVDCEASVPRKLTKSKSRSLMGDVEDSQDIISIRIAYRMAMRVLESGKYSGIELTRIVPIDDVYKLLDIVKPIFLAQPSCVETTVPINVCGDIHGQFSDLLRIFDKVGFPHRENYLFLGDYVDRGRNCLETIILLFSYKVIFPGHFFLLRGNHECPMINKQYGFYDECQRRYKELRLWESFQDVFACMPLTALIGDRILCMHGGVSPKLQSVDQLRSFKRPNYQPESPSLEIDVLWSDPSNFARGWQPNTRGVSYIFGADVLKKLLDGLSIDLVVRAHQVVQDGYEFFANRRLVTLFSAPFYCGQFDNAAAVMNISDKMVCSFKVLRPRKKIARRRIMPAK